MTSARLPADRSRSRAGARPTILEGVGPSGSGGIPRDSAVLSQAGTVAGDRSVRLVARSLLALTKPRIIELLLVTTVPAMMLAEQGLPAPGLLLVTLIGGALAAGSANAINCYLDRDIDALMRRTSRRPLARPTRLAVIRPGEALAFGIALGIVATLMLGLLTNWLTAVLADTAMKFKDDYAAASVPMLPVKAPAPVVARKILFYSYVMVVATLALAPYAGWIYAACAASLGGWFLAEAHRLHSRVTRQSATVAAAAGAVPAAAAGDGKPSETRPAQEARAELVRPAADPAPMRLFHRSIAYLSLLFAVIAVISLLPWGRW